MNIGTRGIRNAFRNGVRTLSIVIILGLSIGLCLTMLIAHRAVGNKINSVKSSIGNTISISPAGFNAGSQANNALTTTELGKVQSLPHITNVVEALSDRLPTTGSTEPSFGRFGGSSNNGSTTSLASPVTLNSAGSGGGGRFFISGGQGGGLPANFSLPVSFLGTNNPDKVNNASITITSGTVISGTTDTNNALISSSMATKNNLKLGSTFSAYNTTLTVSGIFTSSNQGADDTVVLALPALERLSGQNNAVTSAVATVDSLDNLASTTSSAKNTLGSNADVVSAQDAANNAIQPLNSVKTVSLFSLIGAVVAGAVIILLVMVMVVRERKREIGVVKAIGGSNARIMGEFMIESLTLAVLGAVVGLLIGVIGAQPVTKMLVNNNSTSNTTGSFSADSGSRPRFTAGGGQGGGFGPVRSIRANGTVRGLENIKTQIGWGILLDGFGAAVLIAVVGSALAAGMISKIRPSEVLRSI